jgi:hypothetical protein
VGPRTGLNNVGNGKFFTLARLEAHIEKRNATSYIAETD